MTFALASPSDFAEFFDTETTKMNLSNQTWAIPAIFFMLSVVKPDFLVCGHSRFLQEITILATGLLLQELIHLSWRLQSTATDGKCYMCRWSGWLTKDIPHFLVTSLASFT